MNETMSPAVPPTTVKVGLGARSYDILIGRGLLERAGAEIARRLPGAAVAVVTDRNVADHFLEALTGSLAAAGVRSSSVVIEPGEGSKSFATLARVLDSLLAAGLERRDAVLALGGGVVGDLAGFAAGIALRGLRFVQVPTSLLAQVDSSVGGKTGINMARGKNLVGLFHQPILVLADTATLDTLPERQFRAGYAEVAKYGLIDDAAFFTWLEAHWQAVAAGGPEREETIAVSCRAKAKTVAADEREEGERALLNLGHTFGHALEADAGYSDRLLHGEAVAIGMVLAHTLSARLGLCPPADVERVRGHLRSVGLPTEIRDIGGDRPSAEALMERMARDKKVSGGRLTFILTRGIGRAFIANDVPPGTVQALLEEELAP